MKISATLDIFLISDDSESGQHFQRPQDLYSFISYYFTELVQLTARCLEKLSTSSSLSPHLYKLRQYNFLQRWERQSDNVEGSASHITGAQYQRDTQGTNVLPRKETLRKAHPKVRQKFLLFFQVSSYWMQKREKKLTWALQDASRLFHVPSKEDGLTKGCGPGRHHVRKQLMGHGLEKRLRAGHRRPATLGNNWGD